MKSLVLAVIFAGLMTFWNGIFPTSETPKGLTYDSLHIQAQLPLTQDPDDDEDEDHVKTPRRKSTSNR